MAPKQKDIQKDFQKDFEEDVDVNKYLPRDIHRDIHRDMHSNIHRDFHRDIHKEMPSKPVICLENALRFDSQAHQALGDVQNGNPNVDLQWPYVEPHYVEPCYGSTEPAAPAPSAVPTVPAPYEPAPGSTELPSVGSRGHYSGDCKPCSFLYAKGCNNGAMCLFCHLCDRSEKKRRQKAKRAALKGGA